MNLKLLLFLATVAAAASPSRARVLPEPDNSLTRRFERRDWVKFNDAPPQQATHVRGTTLELKCSVIGEPAPTIHWVHGSGQMVDWDDFETNIISESSPHSLSIVHSTLIVDHSTPASERTFTCIARSGGETIYSSTTVFEKDGPNSNFTEMLNNGHQLFGGLKKARIIMYQESHFDHIGQTVILPCKTIGRPLPEVYWYREEDGGNVLSNPRFKLLSTGDLIINNLRWSDMGLYTCVAKNAISKDTVNTFVYPLTPN